MKTMSKWLLLGLLCIGLFVTTNGPRPISAQGPDGLGVAISKSLQSTRRVLAAPSDSTRVLEVAAARKLENADLGTLSYLVKIHDVPADAVYSYWYDREVNPISEDAAFNTRAAAYQSKYGRLSRDLYGQVSVPGRSTSGKLPVAIWGEQSLGTGASSPSGVFRVYLPVLIGGTPRAVDQIVTFLSQRGYSTEYVSTDAPVVYASIPSQVIWDLQAQAYVAAIYDQTQSYPTLDSAARTSAAPWTWDRGLTGKNIKVAVLENDGVAFDNPYLRGSQYHVGWSKRVGTHATEVAGVIASNHTIYRGIAYEAEILSANALTFWESPVVWATDWAIGVGADIINGSFGSICQGRDITSLDKFFDWVVWDKRKTVTIAAGNLRSECSSNCNVSSPGKAYNVITVGAKDDKNTASSETDTKDDQFSYFSLYVDPVTASESRLKPEVVAVGERIRSTSPVSPWIDANDVAGTSFAAPIVAGQAALMMQRFSWLKAAPEALKAGVMASARWTYLHDDANPGGWASIEKMGVGAIDVTASDNLLLNNRIQELYLRKSDFTSNNYDISFDGQAGQRIRVVIVWSSHPNRIQILNWILHDRLESDFDLTVAAPSGQIYGSYAAEANYEIVEFVAPQNGSYRARIHQTRWDDSSMEERIGFAWYSGFPLP